MMWSRNGIVIALLKYSSGFEAGTLFLCVWWPTDLGTQGVTSILAAISTASSNHILWWTSMLFHICIITHQVIYSLKIMVE